MTIDKLQKIFIHRLNDELFIGAAVKHLGKEPRAEDMKLYVWLGYELLTKSRYLNK